MAKDRKFETFKLHDYNTEIEIRYDGYFGIFRAWVLGEVLEDSDILRIKRSIRDRLDASQNIKFVPTIWAEVEYDQPTYHDKSHVLTFSYDRYYLGKSKDNKLIKIEWDNYEKLKNKQDIEDEEYRHLISSHHSNFGSYYKKEAKDYLSTGKYQKSKHKDKSNILIAPYNDELWTGILLLDIAIKDISNKAMKLLDPDLLVHAVINNEVKLLGGGKNED